MSEQTGNGSELTTFCGLYCGACAIKNGQISRAASDLQGILKAYGYAGWAPLMAEYVPATKHYPEFEGVLGWLTQQDCPTCRGGGGPPECAIRICAREKGLAGCWECAELACEKTQGIDEGYSAALGNRRRIQEVGLEAWLAEQAALVEEGFSYLDALSERP